MTSFQKSVSLAALLTAFLVAHTASAYPDDSVPRDAKRNPLLLGEYWVGIVCEEVGDDLRAHVDLPNGQGVIVRKVFPNSAASQAGIQTHDILLSAGKAGLSSPKELLEAVQKSQGKEIRFEVLRKGTRSTVSVTPKKRPKEHRITIQTDRALKGDLLDLDAEKRKLIEQLMKQQKDLRVLLVEPGQVVPKNWTTRKAAALPNGVSVSITRTNNEPARIKVVRGDDSWEITEDEIDKLPEDLQPGIQGMLNREGANVIRLPLNNIPRVIDRRVRVQPGRQIQIYQGEVKQNREADSEVDVKELAREIRRLAEKIEKLEKQQEK